MAHVEDHRSDTLHLMVGEREVVVRDRDLVARILNAAAGASADMSSHREAPEICKDPVADSTDVYAFVSPSNPDNVVLIANYVPLQAPDGGPNFYEFGDDVIYEIHVANSGKGTADISFQFRFEHRDPEPQDVPLQHRPDRVARRQELEPAAVLLGHRWSRTARRRSWPGSCACPPVNVGPRSTPDYAKLSAQAVHKVGKRTVLRRPARGRLPRGPRQHLRPRGAAPAEPGAPDPAGEDGRHQLRAGVQRAHASRSRCRSTT